MNVSNNKCDQTLVTRLRDQDIQVSSRCHGCSSFTGVVGISTDRITTCLFTTGSFRVLQRYALRASTAAPTVFKPVMMGGEMYCDGGIVASNPSAVALHEARALFPNIPIEMVVSIGTGGA